MAQIKSWKSNKILFEHEGKIKDVIQEAVKQHIDLSFADLRSIDLEGANLKGANLRFACINGAMLTGANLEKANLSNSDFDNTVLIHANLKEANLEGANLRYACILGAKFNNANLKDANLEGANLRYACILGAKFNNANLKDANLSERSFAGANLDGANFEGANLEGADLRFAENVPDDAMPLACPATGAFIAWKKVDCKLVKLEIPEDAKRSSATTNKCRCSKAKVLAVTNLFETRTYKEVANYNYEPLIYKVGEMVYPDSFDENRWKECSNGIHFFMDKNEAINW